jgi:hypothetical protein
MLRRAASVELSPAFLRPGDFNEESESRSDGPNHVRTPSSLRDENK